MPTEEQVERALRLLGRSGENRVYFFSRLTSADWIEPLQRAGLFANPPSKIPSSDSIQFPSWPESRYLARVAISAPDRVLGIIEKIRDVDNDRIHEDFVDAALRMPPRLTARIADLERSRIARQDHLSFLLPDKLGELVAYLARHGERDCALRLLRELLRLGPDRDGWGFGRARFEDWSYQRILVERFPEVLASVGEDAVWTLHTVLSEGIDRKREAERFSSHWRPAIEDHEQNGGFDDAKDSLLNAIRDGFVGLLSKDADRIPAVLQRLEADGAELGRRLSLFLAGQLSQLAPAVARERLLLAGNFDEPGVYHEYSGMVARTFPSLDPTIQEKYLQMIRDEEVASGGDEGRVLADRQLLRRLSIVAEHLSVDWQRKYDELTTKYGRIDHPDFLSHHKTWIGPTSPLSSEQLMCMTLEEVVEYLRSWSAADAWQSPTFEGLAHGLRRVVRDKASDFAVSLSSFRDIDPTYARAITEGLEDATSSGLILSWPEVLSYAAWIVGNDRTALFDPKDTLDRDPHWGWARKAVARLLEQAVRQRAIPGDLRDLVWSVLVPITADPDPLVEEQEAVLGDVVNQSINQTRAVALHAVMAFLAWLHSSSEMKDDRGAGELRTITNRVLALLERRLDPSTDPSPAVRSVFGQYLELLAYVDEEWLRERLPRIFPVAHPNLREAAWIGYLSRSRLRDETFHLLRGEYEHAIEDVGLGDQEPRKLHDPDHRLGEHLMILVGRGTIGTDDGTLGKFFSSAPAAIKAHAIGYVGRSLKSERREIGDDFVSRWRQLWDWRTHATSPIEPAEYAEFSWWFASARFDINWSLECFAESLERCNSLPICPFVLEELARLATRHPVAVIGMAERLVDMPSACWSLPSFEDHGVSLLRSCMEDSQARSRAEVVVDQLVAKGYLKFRELVGGAEAPGTDAPSTGSV
jgi:hypothetical protein